jgi:hypothetical protein
MSDKKIAALEKFPEPVVLYASTIKLMAFALIFLFGATLGAAALFTKSIVGILAGIGMIIFMGCLCILSIFVLVTRSFWLKIDAESIQYAFLLRDKARSWNSVRNFRVLIWGFNNRVFFDRLEGDSHKPIWKTVVLPDNFGLSAENLRDLLERWRKMALKVVK